MGNFVRRARHQNIRWSQLLCSSGLWLSFRDRGPSTNIKLSTNTNCASGVPCLRLSFHQTLVFWQTLSTNLIYWAAGAGAVILVISATNAFLRDMFLRSRSTRPLHFLLDFLFPMALQALSKEATRACCFSFNGVVARFRLILRAIIGAGPGGGGVGGPGGGGGVGGPGGYPPEGPGDGLGAPALLRLRRVRF